MGKKKKNKKKKKIPVLFDGHCDKVIGTATMGENGTVTMTVTDPKVIKAIKKGRKKSFASLGLRSDLKREWDG